MVTIIDIVIDAVIGNICAMMENIIGTNIGTFIGITTGTIVSIINITIISTALVPLLLPLLVPIFVYLLDHLLAPLFVSLLAPLLVASALSCCISFLLVFEKNEFECLWNAVLIFSRLIIYFLLALQGYVCQIAQSTVLLLNLSVLDRVLQLDNQVLGLSLDSAKSFALTVQSLASAVKSLALTLAVKSLALTVKFLTFALTVKFLALAFTVKFLSLSLRVLSLAPRLVDDTSHVLDLLRPFSEELAVSLGGSRDKLVLFLTRISGLGLYDATLNVVI